MTTGPCGPAPRPEPCLAKPCRSPSACFGWGYCRERNRDGVPPRAKQAELRARAFERREKIYAEIDRKRRA